MSKKKTLFISCIILTASLFSAWLFIATKPESRRVRAQVSSPVVNVVAAQIGNATMSINALGTVKAAQETIIRPRVVGQVEILGQNSDIGAVVQKDELLVQLDSAVYKNTLSSKKSSLAKAKADYDLEMGQQKVARAEAEQLKNLSASLSSITNSTSMTNSASKVKISALALRAPHLAQAKAAVQAAEADVRLAQLNVNYTTIKAPYNALVIERNVSIGSQASGSDTLLTLVGTDEYRIEASIPLDRLEALNLKNTIGTKVRIMSGAGLLREGTVLRTIATLDPSTRMGRLLISVADPLGLKSNEPALILGDQTQVELIAGTLNNVIVLPRASLHSGDVVWVAVPNKESQADKNSKAEKPRKPEKNSKADKESQGNKNNNYVLDIRPVNVQWKDTQTAYIDAGIESGEFIVTSVIPSPIQGMGLRLAEDNKKSKNIPSKNKSESKSESKPPSEPQGESESKSQNKSENKS